MGLFRRVWVAKYSQSYKVKTNEILLVERPFKAGFKSGRKIKIRPLEPVFGWLRPTPIQQKYL